METKLINIEKTLCDVSSMISLCRLADSDSQAIEIDNVLKLAEEMTDNARCQITDILLFDINKRQGV